MWYWPSIADGQVNVNIIRAGDGANSRGTAIARHFSGGTKLRIEHGKMYTSPTLIQTEKWA